MKISYEQAVERKEQLEKEYRILQQLKKKGKVDPNGPYYCFTLTDMGYDIIDDYGKRCSNDIIMSPTWIMSRPFESSVRFTTDQIFRKNYSWEDKKFIADRDYIFRERDFCKDYLLYLISQGQEKYSKDELGKVKILTELLNNKFDVFIKNEYNSLDKWKTVYDNLKRDLSHTIDSAKKEKSSAKEEFITALRRFKKVKDNKRLIKELDKLNGNI